jgi:hypothetical protein
MTDYTPKTPTKEPTAEQAAQERESARILAWLFDDPTAQDNAGQAAADQEAQKAGRK